MLKRLLGCTSALVVALWLAGAADASSLVLTDVFNPEPDILISVQLPEYSYFHFIALPGHHIHAAHLTLDVRDDSPADKRERVTVDIDEQYYGTFAITGADLHLSFDPTLLDDGSVKVTLFRSKGDFFFRESTLTAQAPEPSTLILLGSGLAGVAYVGFRRRQKAALS